MVTVIKAARGDVETPVKGKAVQLIGSFTIRKVPLEALSKTVILRLLNAKKAQIKKIIDSGVNKEYAKSKLAERTGELKKQSLKYTIVLSMQGNRLTIKAKWPRPSIDHFFIHLFGGTIKAKKPPFLVFRTADGKWHSVKKVKIPRRNFLSFRKMVRAALGKKVIDPTLKAEIKTRSKKNEQISDSTRKIKRGGRVSRFRNRKAKAEVKRRGRNR